MTSSYNGYFFEFKNNNAETCEKPRIKFNATSITDTQNQQIYTYTNEIKLMLLKVCREIIK